MTANPSLDITKNEILHASPHKQTFIIYFLLYLSPPLF